MMRMTKKTVVTFALALSIPVAMSYLPSVTSGLSIEAKAAGVVNVADFGAKANDAEDDTKAFNEAIADLSDKGGGTIKADPGKYVINLDGYGGIGIGLRSNISLDLNGVTFDVKGTSQDKYEIISIKNVSNVSITGLTINGERKSHMGSRTAEDCMGINIKDSTAITLDDLKINNVLTDGIYLGTMDDNDSLLGCKNITIKNTLVSNSGRNNIAIVDADNVTIDNCDIRKAKGISPQCGIIIEPNTNGGNLKKDQICSNITIKNTKVTVAKKAAKNGAFQQNLALMILNPYFRTNNKVVAKNVKVTKCNFAGNVGNYSGKKVSMKNTKIKATFYDHMKTSVKKCTIKNHYKF